MDNNLESSAKRNKNLSLILGLLAALLTFGLIVARLVFPEYAWLTAVAAVLLAADLAFWIQENRNAFKARAVAYGVNSLVTVVLVLGILGVLNFLASKYPYKADLTRNKVNTLSDQTVKVVKSLTKPVHATVYSDLRQREQLRPLLDNYRGLNPKFEVEYVDPIREPTRARQAGIRHDGTIELNTNGRDSKIEDVGEEKLTNALIKLLKDKAPELCAITGHGEKNFDSNDADGYTAAKTALSNQGYEIKNVSLPQEGNRIPAACDAIAIMGPTKAFFPSEVNAIKDYLNNGGRMVSAMDFNLKGGGEFSPEFASILSDWNVKPSPALIVDPFSRMLGVDASVPILAEFSKESPITKDFQINCFFPFARPLNLTTQSSTPKTQWLAKTTPKSWAVTDMQQIKTGQVKLATDKSLLGPLTVAATVEGKLKDSKAPRDTRLVVFGTSVFATNNFSRYGGNLDFFVNSVSWLMEDDSLISIRGKTEGPGKVELTQKSGMFIFLLTVIFVPAIIAIGGVVLWALRRRL